MYVSMICKNRNLKEKNEIYQVLGALSHREAVQIEDLGDRVEIYVCPQGKIKVTEEEDSILLSANTRHAGAGFHAFVVEFCKALQEEIEGEYELYDDLDFDQDEDFHRLYHIYEDELEYMRDLLLKEESVRQMNYMYDETYFLPMEKENRILTCIGDLDREEFKNMHLHDLMDNFYVWNEWERDARFFKNAGLTLLAKEGNGEYSLMNEETVKNAHIICDYFELAYKDDSSIPLPKKTYQYLCEMLDREDKLKDAIEMEEEVIQYRLKEVYHLFEDAKVVALGSCERSYDPVSQSLCLMSPYKEEGEWKYLIMASKSDQIIEENEALKEEEELAYNGKKVQFHQWLEDGIFYLEALLKQEDRTLYFHIVENEEKEVPYLKQCIKESGFQKDSQ